MDADEALARALQEEEVAVAWQQPQQGSADANKAALAALIQNSLSQALSVEDAELQARARALLPLDALRREAQEAAELNALLGEQAAAGGVAGLDDFLVQGLLAFFKRDFFSWVDQPACELCTCPTTGIGLVQPTAAEARDGAGRVEAYRCSVCQQVARFPRYTKPAKLLETRKGRCGEWAHIFLLVLRTLGLDARHVTDSADHVWCEYYSSALGRWVHVDACEEAWDTPLLYEGGWGKELAYVFGCSRHGVTDVTRRYVLQPQVLPTRRLKVPEAWLAATLAHLSNPLQAPLDTTAQRQVALRDAAEALQLMSLEEGGTDAARSAASLPGRQSGAEAWRSARGEIGGQALDASARGTPQATAYQRARDGALPPLFAAAGRITGGACRASGEHRGGQPSEQALRAFDGSLSSKWLDFAGGGPHGVAWLEYRLLPAQEPAVVTHYDLVVAGDCPERDPCEWLLECMPERSNVAGSNADTSINGDGWVVLDQRRGEVFSRRHQLRSFFVPHAAWVASRIWRLRISRVAQPSMANSVQLACWNLYNSTCAQGLQTLGQHGVLPQQSGEAAGDTSLRLLYFSEDAWCTIKKLIACGSAPSDGATPYGSECGTTEDAEAVGVVQRIIGNMCRFPGNAKFWQLGTGGSKIQPVLHHPSLLALLYQAGFRPVMAESGCSSGQLCVRLVADESNPDNISVVSVLEP